MVQELLPLLIMVLVQFEFAGMNILSKLALDSGMNPYIHVAYRQMFASVTLGPLAYFIEREKTSNDLVNFYPSFLLFGFWVDSEPNHILCWFKELNANHCMCVIKSPSSNHFCPCRHLQARKCKVKDIGWTSKVDGNINRGGGAMLLSMYHGPIVPISESGIDVNIMKNQITKDSNGDTQGNLIGPILIIISAFTWAIWFIIQARMGNIYPAPYSSSALMMALATFECSVFGLIMEPHLHEWSLVPAIRAISCIYSGVVCSGIGVCMMSWCIDKKGPFFVSVFSPLLLVIVAALSWALLREKLYLGTLLGSLLIVLGLYCVLWGKTKEMEFVQKEEESQDTKEDMEMQ
ncbi:hypothetical protein Lser_V15G44705 [Lactuca serriola]